MNKQADRSNIGDGINCADFVKMDLIEALPVDMTLRVSQCAENRHDVAADVFRHIKILNDSHDVTDIDAVMRMMMRAVIVIVAAVRMIVLIVRMLMITMLMIVLAVIMLLDGNVIGPKLLSNNIKIHPLLVIAALIGGGALGGLVGMIIAVPVAALCKLQLDRYLDKKEKEVAKK